MSKALKMYRRRKQAIECALAADDLMDVLMFEAVPADEAFKRYCEDPDAIFESLKLPRDGHLH